MIKFLVSFRVFFYIKIQSFVISYNCNLNLFNFPFLLLYIALLS